MASQRCPFHAHRFSIKLVELRWHPATTGMILPRHVQSESDVSAEGFRSSCASISRSKMLNLHTHPAPSTPFELKAQQCGLYARACRRWALRSTNQQHVPFRPPSFRSSFFLPQHAAAHQYRRKNVCFSNHARKCSALARVPHGLNPLRCGRNSPSSILRSVMSSILAYFRNICFQASRNRL